MDLAGRIERLFNEELDVVDGESGAFGEYMAYSFGRQLGAERKERGARVRISSLGKPAVVQALNKLGYVERRPVGKSRLTFLLGDFFENVVGHVLKNEGIAGVSVVGEQEEVDFFGVPGHYDFLVECDGRMVLLECKTMNHSYSSYFKRYQDDSRGYLTQLAVYRSCVMKYMRGAEVRSLWVCFDKDTSETFVRELDYASGAQQALARAENVVKRLGRVKSVADALRLFRLPPGQEEVYRGRTTGRLLVPQSLAYSPFKEVLYETEMAANGYGKEMTYITDVVRDAREVERRLDALVEKGVLEKDALC